MTLDLPTMLWASLAACSVLSLSVLADAWGAPPRDGLTAWGWSLAALALSYPAFALRFFGWAPLSIVLSNLLVSLTLALQVLAVCQFQTGRARPLPRWVIWTPVGAMLVAVTALLPEDRTRSVLSSLILATQALIQSWQAWAPGLRGARVRGRVLLVVGAVALILTMVIRAAVIAGRTEAHVTMALPVDVQAATYLVVLTISLMNTMGYVLMQKDHAVAVQQDLAAHDELTGVSSRRALMEAIERDISRAARRNVPLAMLMIDLDHFKQINDRHGHLVGDDVLRDIAARIRGRLRRYDLFGRYGGEEFIAVLEDTGRDAAAAVAEDIRRSVSDRPVNVDGEDIAVTISIGVHARTPRVFPTEAGEMLTACDKAMYAAKAGGRNRVEVRP